jgi:PucR C-terminal helix-turn-helix domain/GGDEF-like domain
MPRGPDAARVRAALAKRLRSRRAEIDEAVLTRVNAIADPSAAVDPTYAIGLRAAVATAIEYGLEVLDGGAVRPLPVPPSLLAQARSAARSGVGLNTVLRRYMAGHTLLSDFLINEAGRASVGQAGLQRLLRTQAALLDRLVAAVGEEYEREATSRPSSAEQLRTERVRQLLGGELLDVADLAYDIEGHHLGLVGAGPGLSRPLRGLAKRLDHSLLLVQPDDRTAWAWLGGRRPPDPAAVESRLSLVCPGRTVFAVGEPAHRLQGWRLTHRQALAALPIARRRPERPVRYARVALLASSLQDDLLCESLSQIYLTPLDAQRDGGQAARQTLRAYFDAERNVSSAAAALGVSRRTVSNRLRVIETQIGRPLSSDAAELEMALRLDGSRNPTPPGSQPENSGVA